MCIIPALVSTGAFFILPAPVFYSIGSCVAPLCFQFSVEHSSASTIQDSHRGSIPVALTNKAAIL